MWSDNNGLFPNKRKSSILFIGKITMITDITELIFMNIDKIRQKLSKNGLSQFDVSFDGIGIVLTGESDNWSDIVRAGLLAADRKSGFHVINDVKFTGGEIPQMKLPTLKDSAIDGERPDVLVIGGGVVGSAIARELTKWDIDVMLIEKGYDVALGASGRNDGCVHPGVDLVKGTLKQKYNLRGNRMFDDLSKELDFEFKRTGQTLMFKDKASILLLYLIQPYWRLMGLGRTKVLNRKKLFEIEPNVSKEMNCGIYFPTGGIVCPYNMTIAYAENAVDNGARLFLNTAALSMEVVDGKIISVETNRGRVYPSVIVNAAGVFSEEIAKMAEDRFFSIHPRKGTNSILDKKAKFLVNTFYSRIGTQSKKAHTKGGGVVSTVDGNVLVGPNAIETYLKEDVCADIESIAGVFNKQKGVAPALSQSDIITYFSGTRAATFEEDFIVEKGRRTSNIVYAAGIQSPGLTAAPAIALDIEKLCVDILNGIKTININKEYNSKREGIPRLASLPDKVRERLIIENPDFGEIVCRCEEISKGEIVAALHRSVPCDTVDGVKRRVRPGMGRCQGGFCGPLVTRIIAEEKGEPLCEVKKANEKSVILFGESKGAK